MFVRFTFSRAYASHGTECKPSLYRMDISACALVLGGGDIVHRLALLACLPAILVQTVGIVVHELAAAFPDFLAVFAALIH